MLDLGNLNLAVASNQLSSDLVRDEDVVFVMLRSQVQSCSQVATHDVQTCKKFAVAGIAVAYETLGVLPLA